MNYAEYNNLFEKILDGTPQAAPYDKPDYLHYTKLNKARMGRWDRAGELDERLVEAVKNYQQKQHWVIITEPWCGDAAHIIPFLMKLVELNPLFSYEIQLRDAEPFLINSYLTNGSKSIPRLVARDEQGADIYVWGPRPKPAQVLREELVKAEATYEVINQGLQQWYNQDKGVSLNEELLALYTAHE